MKQHIVGSLLFTPLLLLLPTTSVFYIFFSILATTINLICILIGLTISVIHATPYIKIFLWFFRPRRFPSGIWFDVVSSQGDASDSSDNFDSPFENFRVKKVISREKSSLMVSVLHSNFMTLGETSFSYSLLLEWTRCFYRRMDEALSLALYLKFTAKLFEYLIFA